MILFITTDPAGKALACKFTDNDVSIAHSKDEEGNLVDIEELEVFVRKADFVLFDLPTQEKDQERQLILISLARELRIPYGFYVDTFDSYQRPHLGDKERMHAKHVFVPTELILADVSLRFPNADIVPVGNPEWETPPDMGTRDVMRKKFNANADALVFLSPGTKFKDLNEHLWGEVLEAASQAERVLGKKVIVLCSMHPGDESPKDVYASLISDSVYVVYKSEYETRELVPATDVTIGFRSAIALASAQVGIPVIEMRTGPLIERNRELVGNSGKESFPVQSGAYKLFGEDDGELITTIALLLDPTTEQHKEQMLAIANTFPRNPPGTCIKRMLHTLQPYR